MDFTDILNVWGRGQLIAFSGLDGPTDSQNGLVLRTAGPGTLIDCMLPSAARLCFDRAEPQSCRVTGDCFEMRGARFAVRGALLDAWHLLVQGPIEQIDCDDGALRVVRDKDRMLLAVAAKCDPSLIGADLDAAMAARLDWLAQRELPDVEFPLQRTYAKCLSQMKTMVYAPEGPLPCRWSTPDRWPHRHMWLWDSAFHAIGFRHVDVALARELLDAVFSRQHDDGMIEICANTLTPAHRFTQPPVLALAAALVDEIAPDDRWIAAIYPHLTCYLDWNAAHRDTDGAGLLEWAIEGNPNCRSGESGMDNSTRFNSATQLDATDFNAFQSLEYEMMAGFAKRLGRSHEATAWRDRQTRMNALIEERLWDASADFYVDRDVESDTLTGVIASAGFLPLICGAVPAEKVPALVAAYRDPARFATALPIASIAANDPTYSKDMWRGPVWINLNWLISRGFDRYGQTVIAQEIREKTIAVIADGYERFGTIFEFFDDRAEVDPPALLRKGRCAPEISPYHQVFHDYGWSATLFVDLVATQA